MSTSCFRRVVPFLAGLALLAPLALLAQGNTAEGDFLAAAGMYDEAVTSYLRFVFENPGSGEESEVCHKISRGWAALGDSDKALKYADRALAKAGSEAERRERALGRAELLLALGRYEAALLELELLDGLGLERPERGRCWFLAGVAETYLGRWERAAGRFHDYFALTGAFPPETGARVLKLLELGARSVPLDPMAAEVMSYLVPGLGQAYSGDLLQGLNSLLVTGASGALAAWAIVNGDYFDAAAAVVFIFSRFYTGGPYHAARLAVERNERWKNMIARAVFDLLAQ